MLRRSSSVVSWIVILLVMVVTGCDNSSRVAIGGTDKSEHPWGRWEQGAFIKERTRTTTPQGISTEFENWRLLSVGVSGYVVEIRRNAEDPAQRTIAFDQDSIRFSNLVQSAGEETLTIQKRKYVCKVLKCLVKKPSGDQVEVTEWISKETYFPLKSIRREPSDGVVSRVHEVTAIADEELRGPSERTFKCKRIRWETRNDALVGHGTLWETKEIPGGILKLEISTRDKDGKAVQEVTREIIESGVLK